MTTTQKLAEKLTAQGIEFTTWTDHWGSLHIVCRNGSTVVSAQEVASDPTGAEVFISEHIAYADGESLYNDSKTLKSAAGALKWMRRWLRIEAAA